MRQLGTSCTRTRVLGRIGIGKSNHRSQVDNVSADRDHNILLTSLLALLDVLFM